MTVEEAIDVLKKDIKCYTDNPCSEPCEPGGCPYFIGDNDMVKAEQVAIEALERQIKKKVTYEADGYADGVLVYDVAYCPNCDYVFDEDEEGWEQDYCFSCGQRLDWSDEQ